MRLWQKKLAIIAAMNKGYLLDVSGNPAVLTNALAKPLQGVTVYGASGGVGDETRNLYAGQSKLVVNTTTNNTPPEWHVLEPDKTYTIAIYIDNRSTGNASFRMSVGAQNGWNYYSSGTIYSNTAGWAKTTFTVPSTYNDMLNMQYQVIGQGEVVFSKIMLLEGSYTVATMPEYEPYGYKIPVLVGDIPAGYTQLEYIEGTGTQYIETDFAPGNGEYKMRCKIKTTTVPTDSTYLRIFGNAYGIGVPVYRFMYRGTQRVAPCCGGATNGEITTAEWSSGAVYDVEVDGIAETYTVNGTASAYPYKAPTATNETKLYLFRSGFDSATSAMIMYGFSIEDSNGEVIYDLVPAKRISDNVVGMYDTVNDVFYTNAGTGDFVAGAEVLNKTINLYTDAPLIYGDDLRVHIAAKTAYRGTKDISAMQDWEQDFELAEGDNTVSIGTTVQPSAVDWRYRSSVKADSVPFWGVSFTGSNTTGTRTGNAVRLTASISTDTVAGTSDFDTVPAFQQVRVNGYFDANGDFTETAVEGIDSAFAVDGSNGDVWVRFRKSYYRKVIDGSDDTREVTHLPKEGFRVHPLFYNNCTGAETDYAYIAAYKMGWNEADQKVASMSGVPLCQSTYANRNANIANKGLSYSTCLDVTRAKDSNGQYSGMTTVELDFLTTLFMIEFANRSSQAVMGDCTSYNIQVKATAAETGVEHITVSAANAAKFVVGSVVSLGTSTNRNAVACHSIVNRKKITAIDTATGVITIDNGGVTFATTTDTYISTMPYYTGETDSILGHTGTPENNGKHTNKYRGVEDMYGQTEVILSDVIATGSPNKIYRCDDPTAYATSITGSYAPLSYSLAASNGYVTTLGYDAEYPYINITTAVGGGVATYYGDYYNMPNNTSAREVLCGGALHNNVSAGLFYFFVGYGVFTTDWAFAARLSGSGWRG